MVAFMRDGVLMALTTSLLWGITPIFDKLGVEKASTGAVMIIRFTTTFFCILPLYFIPTFREEIFKLDGRTVMYISAAAVISAIFGICLYFMAMKRMEATKVTPICATYPLVTFVLGILILREQFNWIKMLGTALVVAGIALLSL